MEWTAIGKTTANTLLATFEGNGNTIRGIYVNSDTNFNGIFGCYTSIQNLTIKDRYIKGTSYTGGIIGLMAHQDNVTNSTTEKCYNTGKVSGEADTGGIVGLVGGSSGQGAVKNCYSKGEVTGTTSVGAVIGRQTNTTGLNTLNNLYYLNTVGIRAIGELSSNNSSDDETNKIMSTNEDLKSYDVFLKWIDNK